MMTTATFRVAEVYVDIVQKHLTTHFANCKSSILGSSKDLKGR
jgi:hypothetical protein